MALGANLGAPLAQLRGALGRLGTLGTVVARSRIYRTAPVGGPPGQPDYLNAVVILVPDAEHADPQRLLARLLGVEAEFGRVRLERAAPRTLDLDLLDVGGRVLRRAATGGGRGEDPLPELQLPHPRLSERAFVLAPLKDVEPEWRHPGTGASVSELLARVDGSGVQATDLAW